MGARGQSQWLWGRASGFGDMPLLLGTSPAPVLTEGCKAPWSSGAGLDVTPPPSLSPPQGKIPAGRARARLGWAAWRDARCPGWGWGGGGGGEGGQASRADCVALPAEARRRLALASSGQKPWCQIAVTSSSHPTLEAGYPGTPRAQGAKGTRGTPCCTGVWGCALRLIWPLHLAPALTLSAAPSTPKPHGHLVGCECLNCPCPQAHGDMCAIPLQAWRSESKKDWGAPIPLVPLTPVLSRVPAIEVSHLTAAGGFIQQGWLRGQGVGVGGGGAWGPQPRCWLGGEMDVAAWPRQECGEKRVGEWRRVRRGSSWAPAGRKACHHLRCARRQLLHAGVTG